jgi:hypothetical protein
MKRSFRMRQENETGEFCFIVGNIGMLWHGGGHEATYSNQRLFPLRY